MPLVNGVCIPPICMKRQLIRPGAQLLQIIVRGGMLPQTKIVTNDPLYAPLLPQGLNQLAAMADVDCDGCVCAARVRFNPPVNTPASLVVQKNQDTDAAGVTTVYVYVVTAQWRILSLGMCFPPGALIKVGENFVPVEEAPKTPMDWPPPGGGGSGGKKGKKKGKAVTPPRKKATGKAKAKPKATKTRRRR